jgi:hypothetical protein
MNTTAERIGDLVELGVSAGTSMLDFLLKSPAMPKVSSCSCEIPPPCWMPRELRPVKSHVCAGGKAMLRIRVTNCSIETTTVTLAPAGDDAGKVKVSPKSVSLGPLERGVLTASIDVDAKAASGSELEVLVWVRGCVDHVVRWTVRVSSLGKDACHELDVEDCPDYVHHWYDHFYCARPCRRRSDRD